MLIVWLQRQIDKICGFLCPFNIDLSSVLSLPVEHRARPLVSIQLCLVLPAPSSSSCNWNLLFTFLCQDLSDCPVLLWPSDVHCNACLAILSSLFLSMCPSRLIIALSYCIVSHFICCMLHTLLQVTVAIMLPSLCIIPSRHRCS